MADGNGHIHAPTPNQLPLSDFCPLCGQPVTSEEFVRIQERIREELRANLEKERQSVKQEADKKIAQAAAQNAQALKAVTSQRDEAVRERKLGEANRATQTRKLLLDAEEAHKKELSKQREILAREADAKQLRIEVQSKRERETLQKQIFDLSRKLERKTAGELGDAGEIDLYETLRSAFPDDRITRVAKGSAGADILVEVVYKGRVCARIIIESKNTRVWHKSYLTKLRADQAAAKADHAILCAIVFPAGKKELFIEKGLVVVSPARAVHIVQMLRVFSIRMHVSGISPEERPNQQSKLYTYIKSPSYARLFDELGEIADKLADLDVGEVKNHRKVWDNRGRLTNRLKSVISEIDGDITSIVETKK
jgi:hypothetical protein